MNSSATRTVLLSGSDYFVGYVFLLSIVRLPQDFKPQDCLETGSVAGQQVMQIKSKDALPIDHFLSAYAGRQVIEFVVDEKVFPVAIFPFENLKGKIFVNALRQGACLIRLRQM